MDCVNEVCKLSTFGSRSTRTERRADSAVVLGGDAERGPCSCWSQSRYGQLTIQANDVCNYRPSLSSTEQSIFSEGNAVLLQSLASERGLCVKHGRVSGTGIRDPHCEIYNECLLR